MFCLTRTHPIFRHLKHVKMAQKSMILRTLCDKPLADIKTINQKEYTLTDIKKELDIIKFKLDKLQIKSQCNVQDNPTHYYIYRFMCFLLIAVVLIVCQ